MKQIQMLNVAELQKLFGTTIFSSLDASAIEKLQPLLERKSCARGEYLRHTDKECGDLYIIESGRFALADSEHSVLAYRTNGECIGLLSTLFAGPQLLDSIATEESIVIQLDAGSMKMLEFSDPHLSLQLMRCIRSALAPLMHDGFKLMYNLYKS